ncbi:MAG: sugar phosphate isomerase/epimerase [Clostridiaceae bacterium]|jgi:L-ribulose-5-phosphate 3-epimerase|nr:sugar phosphate isomerase/epimerase [Clostridiaceae bacterium]
MIDFKIGVIVDSFRIDIKDAVKKAKEIGADGIQVYTTRGPMAPENLNSKQRKEFLDYVTSNGLVISALCGDLGEGFADRENNPRRIEKSKMIMDLAKDLNTSVVTTHIGVIPEDSNHPRWAILQEACEQLGEYGDKVGAYFAIETGPETSATLKKFLDSLRSRGVRVNLDPANLVMVTGDDPVQAVYNLKDYIVHTHAKDGIMLRKGNPEVIYGMIEEEIQLGAAFKEVPLGEGSVDFKEYLKALNSIGYNSFLTIEREVGENPEKDIRTAVDFLKKNISLLNE